MALGNRQRVTAPAVGAVRRGLIAAAIQVDDADERWVGGFAYEPAACGSLLPRPVVCEDTTKPSDVDPAGPREYDPVYLTGADVCTTLDNGRDRIGLARANLLATQSHQLEQEFWDGVATRAATPDLANAYLAEGGAGGAEVLTDDPVGYGDALAILDDQLARCLHGTQGMIHATPLTVALWLTIGAIRVEGQRLLTAMDNIVVAGSGYSGSAPGASAGDAPIPPANLAAEANVYGTGLVYVRLGAEARIGESAVSEVDRSVNTQTVLVERPAAATFAGCCLLTIPVDHTSAGSSGGGGSTEPALLLSNP